LGYIISCKSKNLLGLGEFKRDVLLFHTIRGEEGDVKIVLS